MNRIVRAGVMLLALFVFIGSGAVVLQKEIRINQGEEAYAAVEELAGLTAEDMEVPLADAETVLAENTAEQEDTEEQEDTAGEEETDAQKEDTEIKSAPIPQVTIDSLKKLDMEALKQVNDDVEGWILIPGTKISYPVMQAADNEFYLSRTWDKTWNWMGSIFIECQNRSDLSEFNTIIYGHNMRNTSMFSSLKSYGSQSYWEKNPSIYIANEEGVHKYNIFAAFEVKLDGHAYWLNIEDENVKKAFIQKSIKMSDIDTGIIPETSDRIITLSTCTGLGHETRWVVQAVLETE